MAAGEGDDAFVVRPSARKQLKPIWVLVVCLILSAVIWATGVLPWWLVAAGCAVFLTTLVVGLLGVLRARRKQWELRLDANGVTPRGQRTVAWSELTALRVTRMFPRVPFDFLGTQVAALLPQPGVVLPAVPSSPARGRASRTRMYGTNLAILVSAMDTDADEVKRAVDRFSGGLHVHQ